MARQLAAFVVLLVMLVLTPPARAQTAMRKVGRGLAGMTTSVLERPRDPPYAFRSARAIADTESSLEAARRARRTRGRSVTTTIPGLLQSP